MPGFQEEGIGLNHEPAELPRMDWGREKSGKHSLAQLGMLRSCTRASAVRIQGKKLKSNCRGNNGRAS